MHEKNICKECKKIFYKEKYRKAQFCSHKCSTEFIRIKPIHCFENISIESAYWIGFLFGDGFVNKNVLGIGLSSSKEENKKHLEKFSQFWLGKNLVKKYNHQFLIKGSCSKTIKNLKQYSIIENKSLYGKIKIPSNFEQQFILGYFDADGWISINQYQNKNNKKYYDKLSWGICSYLEYNLIEIQKRLPVKSYISKKKKQELFELKIQKKQDIITIRDWLYIDNLGLKWKKQKFFSIN